MVFSFFNNIAINLFPGVYSNKNQTRKWGKFGIKNNSILNKRQNSFEENLQNSKKNFSSFIKDKNSRKILGKVFLGQKITIFTIKNGFG
ncbi:hypothetical protein JL36_08440 [Lactococcus cremoris]|nr:hypothetical protein JL36_08440 [Lactococcus cremoris]